MPKLKLKLKKPLGEKINIREHVEVPNATYIGTGNNMDVFDVRTYDAMQQFKFGNTDNACDFTHGRSDFDSHIVNGPIHLYLFVEEDTNKSFGAVISGQNNQHIKWRDSNSFINANLCFEDIEGNGNNLPGPHKIPLHLVPGFSGTFNYVEGDSDDVLNSLSACSNLPVPQHDALAPAEEPEDEPIPVEEPEEEEPVEEESDIVDEPATETPTQETPADDGIAPFKYIIQGKEAYITHIKITPRMKADRKIVIPAELGGKPVTKLWKYSVLIPVSDDYTHWKIVVPSEEFEVKNYAVIVQDIRSSVSFKTPDMLTSNCKRYTNSIYNAVRR